MQHEFLRFDDKQRVKTHNLSRFFWKSKHSSVKIFLYKVQNVFSKCPSPAEMRVFRLLQKSLIALLIVVCGKSSQICGIALFSSGMIFGLWVKFVKCLKHCTPHMIAKWVNLVAIHTLQWSRYSEKWKFIGWLHLIWHTSVKFRDNWIKFCNLP